ncbi:MAG: dockerin type I repeat-containing protein [Oscillospiraceae bacterium]
MKKFLAMLSAFVICCAQMPAMAGASVMSLPSVSESWAENLSKPYNHSYNDYGYFSFMFEDVPVFMDYRTYIRKESYSDMYSIKLIQNSPVWVISIKSDFSVSEETREVKKILDLLSGEDIYTENGSKVFSIFCKELSEEKKDEIQNTIDGFDDEYIRKHSSISQKRIYSQIYADLSQLYYTNEDFDAEAVVQYLEGLNLLDKDNNPIAYTVKKTELEYSGKVYWSVNVHNADLNEKLMIANLLKEKFNYRFDMGSEYSAMEERMCRTNEYEIVSKYDISAVNADGSSGQKNEITGIMYGDISGDDRIDVLDLSTLALYLIGESRLEYDEMEAADVSYDGYVNMADLARLRQYISHITEKLGPSDDIDITPVDITEKCTEYRAGVPMFFYDPVAVSSMEELDALTRESIHSDAEISSWENWKKENIPEDFFDNNRLVIINDNNSCNGEKQTVSKIEADGLGRVTVSIDDMRPVIQTELASNVCIILKVPVTDELRDKKMIARVNNNVFYDQNRIDNCSFFNISSFGLIDEINVNESLTAVVKSMDEFSTLNSRYSGYFDSLAEKAGLSDEFFAKNKLFVLYLTESTASARNSVNSMILSNSGKVSMSISRYVPELCDDAMQGWILAAAVPDESVKKIEEKTKVSSDLSQFSLNNDLPLYGEEEYSIYDKCTTKCYLLNDYWADLENVFNKNSFLIESYEEFTDLNEKLNGAMKHIYENDVQTPEFFDSNCLFVMFDDKTTPQSREAITDIVVNRRGEICVETVNSRSSEIIESVVPEEWNAVAVIPKSELIFDSCDLDTHCIRNTYYSSFND